MSWRLPSAYSSRNNLTVARNRLFLRFVEYATAKLVHISLRICDNSSPTKRSEEMHGRVAYPTYSKHDFVRPQNTLKGVGWKSRGSGVLDVLLFVDQ